MIFAIHFFWIFSFCDLKNRYKRKQIWKKKRVIINIRDLNQIIQTNVYFMSFQFDIITIVTECSHISIVDIQKYFYQWTVREKNRYKQIVITHRDQKQFNVIVMKFKNSSTYVQKQTNFMLRKFCDFVKIYIDDIVFFFVFLNQHIKHLNKNLQRFFKYDVILNSKKFFFEYSSIVLFDQIMNVFEMIIFEKKLATIIKLTFSKIFKKLKIYVKLINWMRNYIFYYAQISKLLQNRKILLLKNEFIKNNFKKRFSIVRMLKQFIIKKYESYQHLQKIFNKSNFLIYFNSYRSFFINVNAFKQINIDVMIFHVINDSENDETFNKNQIQFIMFLNKRFLFVETKYWFTKLEVIDVIWIIKKMRHFIKSCKKSSMSIFTNHAIIVEIISQTFLTTINTNKLNLRLIRASQFLFILFIKIQIKSEKFHVVSNVLSRLKSIAIIENTFILKNLNDVKFMIVKFMIVKNMMIMNVVMKKKFSWNVKFYFVHEILNC